MEDQYSYLLLKVFRGFIDREPALLRAIEEFDGELRISNGALTFTVPGLFEFVRRARPESPDQGIGSDRERYLRFRGSLYANPTNSLLKAQGGRVEVVSANANHDLSVYRLVRVTGPG